MRKTEFTCKNPDCKTPEEKHHAHGYCKKCFWKVYRKLIKPNPRVRHELVNYDGVMCHFKSESPFPIPVGKTFKLDYKNFTVIKTKGNVFYAMLTNYLK